MKDHPPIVWSVSGTDSGGGAGMSADQRAVEAFGAHLCSVVAAVTAQNSVAVTAVQPVPTEMLDAQLAALASDLPPRAIKCGLLGSAANAHALARWVDRLRAEHGPIALVVDPVLSATTGARFVDAELLAVYRHELLPRATAISPNQREAAELAGAADDSSALARALQHAGARAVCITGGDASGALALDWLAAPHAAGWLALPRVPTPHHHGTGCTFASAWAAALSLGFVEADAAILAKMATTGALRAATALGLGAGPVRARAGFGRDPTLLPMLSPAGLVPQAMPPSRSAHRAPGVYAIVDSADRVAAAFRGGADTVQLRIKTPPDADAAWQHRLRAEIAAAVDAAHGAGRPLFVNDHWREAIAAGAHGVHIGQEDLLALTPADAAELGAARARGLALGLSSHSLWELARAATEAPDYIACGPVWPTTTKAMPWRPQGLHNLAWWAAMAPAPVVAIGGILAPEMLAQAAAHGARGGCVVRGLGDAPERSLPGWRRAWLRGLESLQGAAASLPSLPHPTL
jgi:hydroxymethylpyrimidine kinase / phosphomethylpyrimidine kinase / thiamine-phosphate diphosphorylase